MAKSDVSVLDKSEGLAIDPDIARYEQMPINQINRELRAHGIDAARTIADVKRFVKERSRASKNHR